MNRPFSTMALGVALGCLLAAGAARAQTAPADYILDQGRALSPEEHRTLADTLRSVAKRNSVRVYFVSFREMPERLPTEPIARLPKEWLGPRLGAIYFFAADNKQYVVTASPGLSKALGEEGMRSLASAMAEPKAGGGLVENVVAFADAVGASVREARVRAAGELPERPMEWNPETEDWTPLMPTMRKREDELARAASLEESGSEAAAPASEAKPEASRTGAERSYGMILVCIVGGVVALGGGAYLYKLLRYEHVLERSYHVPRTREAVAARFGALASGGHGAAIDLRERNDSES